VVMRNYYFGGVTLRLVHISAQPEVLLIACHCPRTHSSHSPHPPWPGHLFPLQLNLTVCS